MVSLLKKGINWFVDMMNQFNSFDYVELSHNVLQMKESVVLSIKSDSVDIKFFFGTDDSSYSVISYPGVPKEAVKVSVTASSDIVKITIDEITEKLKAHNATVVFHVNSFVKSLTIKSNTGDIAISGCRAHEAVITSKSGDVIVSDHIFPCQINAESENGDVTNADCVNQTSENKLVCKTVNGDILLN